MFPQKGSYMTFDHKVGDGINQGNSVPQKDDSIEVLLYYF